MVHKFEFGPQALGLQFLSFIIGTLIGEVGGYLSDKLVQWGHKTTKVQVSGYGLLTLDISLASLV